MPKKQPESTTKATRRLPPVTIASFAIGKQVSYIGQDYKNQYGGVALIVDEIVRDGNSIVVACRKPDGYFTTWLNPDELTPADRALPLPIGQPATASTPILPEVLTRADAQKLKDIVTIWWDVYYPEHTQSLTTQLFGWQSVGVRYSAETVFEWLKVQKPVVRDRVAELYEMVGRSPEVEPEEAVKRDDIEFVNNNYQGQEK